MQTNNNKAYLALAFICFFWGTTYLALRIGVSGFPPILFAGIRQTTAGLMLLAFVLIMKRNISITWEDVRYQLIPGFLMITIGNGVVAWASKFLPSGITAILTSIMPVYVVLIHVMKGNAHTLNRKILSGLLLGVVGLMLIFKDHLIEIARPEYFWSIVVILFSAFGWALGSVYLKEKPANNHPFVRAALQLLIGGVLMLLISPFMETWSDVKSMPVNSIWAMLYLIVFGSILAYICYLYALKHLPVGLVSIHAYINPVVAVILGYLILDEKISMLTLLAMFTILSGVYLMNRGYNASTFKK
jgi:drug/metabolite transporter (DMT)-like permease